MERHLLYKTPEGFDDLLLKADGEYLTDISFVKNEKNIKTIADGKEAPVFAETAKWLDAYFRKEDPGFMPRYRIEGLTPFRKEVLDIIAGIPYGRTMTYGDIAGIIAERRGIARMSAQAVGNATGWNPLCIIIPCHRVVGTNGDLTGYGGGLSNKIALLRHEGNDMNEYHLPNNDKIK